MDDRYTPPPANTPSSPETSDATGPDVPVASSEAPPPIGVYDRPENTGGTNNIIIGVVAVIILILLAILLVMFLF